MLTAEEAKRIGIRACIDKIGYEFCKKHADLGVCSCGENDGIMECYVGVDDRPEPEEKETGYLLIDDEEFAPYYASCNVNMEDGSVEFTECCLPEAV
ncbi:MAG: hypothetical protein E7260_11140 [Lachnospiraceae bacterium]|nr:hypothetical protein [Lachnospiraceae bacterium]